MKLCRFTVDGEPRLGLVADERVIDLSTLSPDLPLEPAVALEASGGAERLAVIAEGAKQGRPLEEVRLLSPARPRKYLAIARNYADHIAETGMEAPKVPTFFNKQVTCVVGPGAGIHKPKVSDRLDYEGELAIVIGRRCRHVPVERAAEVIAGYTIANDVSVRDWQMRAATMTIGKSFDTQGPSAPGSSPARRSATRSSSGYEPSSTMSSAKTATPETWCSTASSRSPTSRKRSPSSPAT